MQDVTKETGLPCSSNWFCFGSLAARPLQAASKKSETSGGMDSALPTFGVTSSDSGCTSVLRSYILGATLQPSSQPGTEVPGDGVTWVTWVTWTSGGMLIHPLGSLADV